MTPRFSKKHLKQHVVALLESAMLGFERVTGRAYRLDCGWAQVDGCGEEANRAYGEVLALEFVLYSLMDEWDF